jgi:nucleotide-binding universal stress UspA family protein
MNAVKKILIAIDDGPISEKVALNGFQLGQQLNAELALVSVTDTTLMRNADDVTQGEMENMVKSELRKNQQILIDKVFKDFKVSTFVEEGKPYEMILKVADEWEADLIVLGTHGRTGLKHLLMGSVAEKLMKHSAKPLVIIPAKWEP